MKVSMKRATCDDTLVPYMDSVKPEVSLENNNGVIKHDIIKDDVISAEQNTLKKRKLSHVSEFDKLIQVNQDPNGGAKYLLCNARDVNNLQDEGQSSFVEYFLDRVFEEDQESNALNCMGIVRNGFESVPNLLEELRSIQPSMPIKMQSLITKNSVQTLPFTEYLNKLRASYDQGTSRYYHFLNSLYQGCRN